jgi:hypothetical protein
MFLVGSLVFAGGSKKPKDSGPSDEQKAINVSELKGLMYESLGLLTDLQPLMVNEKLFLDPAQDKLINEKLKRFSEISAQVHKFKDLQGPGFKVSGASLNSHVQEMTKSFKNGNKKYARWMLASTPFACISCHTQGTRSQVELWNVQADDLKGSPFDRAEFLFATRNFAQAIEIYDSIIKNFPGTMVAGQSPELRDLETSLKRELTYFVRMAQDPGPLMRLLEAASKNAKIPDYIRVNIRFWNKELAKLKSGTRLSSRKTPDLITATRKLMDGVSRGQISSSNPKLVSVLDASAALYQRLDQESLASADKGEILHLLALTDLSLNNEFFFSLGHLYLKECMKLGPTVPAAKNCYQDYDAEVRFQYSGSRGEDLPQEVKTELGVWRQALKIDRP